MSGRQFVAVMTLVISVAICTNLLIIPVLEAAVPK